MKNILYKIRLLLLSIFLFLLAFFFDKGIIFFNLHTPTVGFELVQVQKTFHNKEQELEQILNTLTNDIKDSKFKELSENQKRKRNFVPDEPSLFLRSYLQDIDENGYTILIFQDELLKFWSDNSIAIHKLHIQELTPNKVIKLSNGFYFVDKRVVNNVLIFGLIRIKQKFSYENDLLQNHFHPDFKLPGSIQISLEKSQNNNIHNRNNQFIFSLVPMFTPINKKPYLPLSIVLYSLSIIAFIFFINNLFLKHLQYKNNFGLYLIILALALFLIRYWMLHYKIPPNFYSLDLFTPHGASNWFPSLGDLLINAFFILLFIRILFVSVKVDTFHRLFPQTIHHKIINLRYRKPIFVIFGIVFTTLYFGFIHHLFRSLISNSKINFEVYKLLDVTVYSVIGFIIIALLFSSYLILYDKVISFSAKKIPLKHFFIYYSVIFLPTFIFILLFDNNIDSFTIAFFVIITIIIAYLRYKGKQYRFNSLVLLIFLISLYTVVFITYTLHKQEKSRRKIKVVKLATERDRIAEHLLEDIDKKINRDNKLLRYMEDPVFGKYKSDLIHNYLEQTYFHGFWQRYALEVTICGSSDVFPPENNLDNCIAYYTKLVRDKGTRLPNSSYYFINNMNGSISYFGYYQFESKVDQSNITLFIELNSILTSEELVYPELLLDYEADNTIIEEEYSYAKYRNERLISKKGNFPYSLRSNKYPIDTTEFTFVNFGEFSHLIYRIDDENIIILSKPEFDIIDVLTSFSYIFFFNNILLALVLFISHLPNIFRNVQFNFKNKILLAMIAVLLLSFLLVGGGTVYYDVKRYENIHNQNMSEKIESVVSELELIFGYHDFIPEKWSSDRYINLNQLLIDLSIVFFNDLNLYDLKGNLIASSRPEIFERGLISKQLNTKAYKALIINHEAQFIQNETIGNLTYSSAYIPFKNMNNKVLAYINMPYLSQPSLLKQEISTLLITVINLYVLLFLLTIVVAVFLSENITYPLRLLQNRFKEINLSEANQQILDYHGKDEIGGLVKEYNRMVVELEKSVKLLAKSERESAWREMAKQIAHEIKNPLTPMKLSIQFLLRSWESHGSVVEQEKFKKRLEGVSKTLIDQIDTLSTIASEFSNFAKMPKANNQKINIVNILQNIEQLFTNADEAEVIVDLDDYSEILVFADKEQLSRVFINLVKNAIQAIPDDTEGIINLKLIDKQKTVCVVVQDNGSGISNEAQKKLFTPSFTTKSGGMGMGLAIVKKIVEDAGGTIWFETEMDKGTTFFVELPKTNKQSRL